MKDKVKALKLLEEKNIMERNNKTKKEKTRKRTIIFLSPPSLSLRKSAQSCLIPDSLVVKGVQRLREAQEERERRVPTSYSAVCCERQHLAQLVRKSACSFRHSVSEYRTRRCECAMYSDPFKQLVQGHYAKQPSELRVYSCDPSSSGKVIT